MTFKVLIGSDWREGNRSAWLDLDWAFWASITVHDHYLKPLKTPQQSGFNLLLKPTWCTSALCRRKQQQKITGVCQCICIYRITFCLIWWKKQTTISLVIWIHSGSLSSGKTSANWLFSYNIFQYCFLTFWKNRSSVKKNTLFPMKTCVKT